MEFSSLGNINRGPLKLNKFLWLPVRKFPFSAELDSQSENFLKTKNIHLVLIISPSPMLGFGC